MATISFTTEFQLAPDPKVFQFIDTTNYAAQGVPSTSTVNGVFTIVSPSGGVIYSNTDFSDSGCDIKVSTSVINKLPISLPVNASDLVEKGIYTITYSVYDTNTTDTYVQVNTYDNEYTAAEIDILVVVNIIGQVFSQTDDTDYTVNGVDPIVTIVNTLKYPTGIKGGPPPDVVTTASTLTTDDFYNGTQTSTITATVTYTFPGLGANSTLIVSDSLYGSKETLVDGAFYCSLICGLKSFEASLCECTQAQYEIKNAQFVKAMALVALVMAEINCNGGDGIDDYLTQIKDIIGDCNCGCGDDDDDDYSRITGWGTILGTQGAQGDPGATGATGATGAAGVNASNILLVNDIDVDIPHDGVAASLKSYTVDPSDAQLPLTVNGDALEISASFSMAGAAGWFKNIQILFGGANVTPSIGAVIIANGAVYMSLKMIVTRRTATTISILGSWSFGDANGFSVDGGTLWESSVTVPTLTGTNLIDIQGTTMSPDTIVCDELLIKNLKL